MKIFVTILLAVCFLNVSAQDYTMAGNEVKPSDEILFETGTAKLLPQSNTALRAIASYLDAKTYITLLRVEGHTDGTGLESANQQLSEQRAMAVCLGLVSFGVDCKRLIAVGFGGTKPIESNDTQDGKAANRRISFINVALKGHLIGGLPADGGGVVAGDTCE